MQNCFLKRITLLSFGAALCFCSITRRAEAQEDTTTVAQKVGSLSPPTNLRRHARYRPQDVALIVGTHIHQTDLDCSHFVQYLYESAGLHYDYAPSRTLYAGADGFRRVSSPEPGDLIVWPGHVGIVVDPREGTFLSSVRSGVKTHPYETGYWRRRGNPRFMHYLGFSARSENRQQRVNSSAHGTRALANGE